MPRRPSLPGLLGALRGRPPRVATAQIHRSGSQAFGGGAGGAGPAGAAGRAAGFLYTYLTDTALTDPGGGNVKFNSTTFASINSMRISETDGDGNSLFNYLATLDDPTSTIKGYILMRRASNLATFAVFSITGTLTDAGTWDELGIAHVVSAGSFANTDLVYLSFFRTGDQGPQGIQGNVGPQGPTGGASPSFKDACRAATTGNITIATALNSGDVIDGVTLANGDRVLVKDQTTASENGIYNVAASPARATDADATGEIVGGTVVRVQEGTANADTEWVVTNDGTITIGTTGIVWRRETLGARTRWWMHGTSNNATAGTATNRTYLGEVDIRQKCTLTGVSFLTGPTSAGNVKAGLYDAAGNKLAETTATIAVAGPTSIQEVPFASTVTVQPGTYFVAIIFSTGTSIQIVGHNCLCRATLFTAASFAIPATVTPPSAGTAGLGAVPLMGTY